jgi:cysteinyl-tRNA synthetase
LDHALDEVQSGWQQAMDKDFQRADELRNQLQAMGVSVIDGPTGTRWKRV